MTEREITAKYYDIEDKIPSVFDSWETVGVNLSRDIANLEDIISVELIRVISILNNRKIVDLTHKIKREFMFIGLYPNKQKALNIFPDRLSVVMDEKDIYGGEDPCSYTFYQCLNCKDDEVLRRNKFCGNCGSLIIWK